MRVRRLLEVGSGLSVGTLALDSFVDASMPGQGACGKDALAIEMSTAMLLDVLAVGNASVHSPALRALEAGEAQHYLRKRAPPWWHGDCRMCGGFATGAIAGEIASLASSRLPIPAAVMVVRDPYAAIWHRLVQNRARKTGRRVSSVILMNSTVWRQNTEPAGIHNGQCARALSATRLAISATLTAELRSKPHPSYLPPRSSPSPPLAALVRLPEAHDVHNGLQILTRPGEEDAFLDELSRDADGLAAHLLHEARAWASTATVAWEGIVAALPAEVWQEPSRASPAPPCFAISANGM